MVALSTLWLPILVSAVFVFIASSISWMNPFWHRKDYDKVEGSDAGLVSEMSRMRSGMYLIPSTAWENATPEARVELRKGPFALLLLRNPGSQFSFPVALFQYFVYSLALSLFVAYIASITMPAGTHYMRVFRVVGTAGVIGYSFGMIPDSIWYGRPWRASIKTVVDGVVYGLLMAGTFGWLWPK